MCGCVFVRRFSDDYLQNFDLVSGWKKRRYDSVVAKLPVKTGRERNVWVELNDFNCGLKHIKI
jgi:hypothetical protein